MNSDMRYIGKMFSTGWRICIRRGGESTFEYFPFTKYGGEVAALKAAKKRRDEIAPRQGFYIKRRDNITGVCGISLHFEKKPYGSIYVAWVLKKWRAGEINKNVYFSIRKYGYVGAWKRALKERVKDTGQKELLDTPPPIPDKRVKKWAKMYGVDLTK